MIFLWICVFLFQLKNYTVINFKIQFRCAEYDELDNLHETISDVIERSLKRGTSAAEKIVAAKLASLLMLVSINLDNVIADSVSCPFYAYVKL